MLKSPQTKIDINIDWFKELTSAFRFSSLDSYDEDDYEAVCPEQARMRYYKFEPSVKF